MAKAKSKKPGIVARLKTKVAKAVGGKGKGGKKGGRRKGKGGGGDGK